MKDNKVLAINFTHIFPTFKEYAKRTSYEGELLDKDSYQRLFKECDYIVETSHPVKYGSDGISKRSICIDIEKAKEAGLNLEGFEL